jgi:hypothetical protein
MNRDLAASIAELPPLTRLGRYVLLLPIGRGGMANVFLATHVGPAGFHKELVVKALRAELTESPEILAMFMEEARLSARLNHPNVVQTYEVGREGGFYFLAMEYLDGQPLHRLLTRAAEVGDLPPIVALRIVADALRGLHYAHDLADLRGEPLGLVHRDVSPHNIFVTYDGAVKVVDFGIAKALGSSVHTAVGTFKGKVAYMPPEQCLGKEVDRRADVFSMGAVLFEALAGKRLWGKAHAPAIVARLAEGRIPALEDELPRELPPGCHAILARALAPDPEQRFATAEEFRLELERVLAAEGGGPDPARVGAWVSTLFDDERGARAALVKAQVARLEGGEVTLSPGHLRGVIFGVPTTVTDTAVTTMSTVPGKSRLERSGVSARLRRARRLRVRLAIALGVVLSSLASAALVHLATRAAQERSAPPWRIEPSGASALPPRPSAEPRSCGGADRPMVELSGDIEEDATLTCDRVYHLRFTTFVRPGVTLTIEPGTILRGDHETRATLVVQRGAQLIADGRPERPIVFTSDRAAGEAAPGDWGGVVLLGRAPINLRDRSGRPMAGEVEGIDAHGHYGGDDPEDSSGTLRYVRIEYSGIRVAPNNEINGLTLAGVGRGTIIDHVQVRETSDDCFEFFGGTVDARYLICDAPGDDGFDWDYGYTGRLQFLLLRDDPARPDATNGLEGDNDPMGTAHEPRSAPVIYNATLCGNGGAGSRPSIGVLVRRASRLTLRDAIVTGFHVGFDVIDRRTDPDVRATTFFGQSRFDGAAPEGSHPGADPDDDSGRDEDAALRRAERENRFAPIDGVRCAGSGAQTVAPSVAVTEGAEAPPNDGFFDPRAAYRGAFRDAEDRWDEGGWAVAPGAEPVTPR